MKKRAAFVMAVILFTAANLYAAAGDVFVEGKLGVGTTSPTEKLEVNGNVKANNTAKAWVSFNGISEVVIYASDGVASVQRVSAGVYKITWSAPFADRNYIVLGTCNMWGTSGAHFGLEGNNISGHTYEGLKTDSVKIGCRDYQNDSTDSDLIHVMAFGMQ